MPALRFRFRLTPLDEVEPWGRPGRLHWFGLTDGQDWFDVDGRLWEDLLKWAPRVLERVSDHLVVVVAGDHTPSGCSTPWSRKRRGCGTFSTSATCTSHHGPGLALNG